jgi:hypothetical protein
MKLLQIATVHTVMLTIYFQHLVWLKSREILQFGIEFRNGRLEFKKLHKVLYITSQNKHKIHPFNRYAILLYLDLHLILFLGANFLEQKRANLKTDKSISVDIHDLEHPVKQHVTHSGLST